MTGNSRRLRRLWSEFFKSSNGTHKADRSKYQGNRNQGSSYGGNRPRYDCCTATIRFHPGGALGI
jgi:hypothetical protein